MLADMAVEIMAAKSMIYRVAWEIDENIDRKVAHAHASVIKLHASEMAGRVLDKAVQIFGGRGYMRENPVERLTATSRRSQSGKAPPRSSARSSAGSSRNAEPTCSRAGIRPARLYDAHHNRHLPASPAGASTPRTVRDGPDQASPYHHKFVEYGATFVDRLGLSPSPIVYTSTEEEHRATREAVGCSTSTTRSPSKSPDGMPSVPARRWSRDAAGLAVIAPLHIAVQ